MTECKHTHVQDVWSRESMWAPVTQVRCMTCGRLFPSLAALLAARSDAEKKPPLP